MTIATRHSEQPHSGREESRLLPKGWRWAKLGDICSITMGQSPEGSTYNTRGIGDPLLNGPTEFGEGYPRPIQWTTSPTRFAEQGDILLCVRGATTGRKNIADKRYCIGRGLAAIRGEDQQAATEFLWFALDLVTNSLLRDASGSTFPNLPGDKLGRTEIPLPPLPEQRRIAAILQDQLAAVERARAAAEEQIKAAEALPAAYLRAVLNSPEAQQWPQRTVAELCERIDYGYTASANFAVTEPRFLRITDIQDGVVNWAEVPGCMIGPEEERSNRLEDGDIVFARTGATTGKSFLIRQPPRAVFASYLIRLRPAGDVRSDYLYAFFQSDSYWKQIRASARGGIQPNVNAKLLGAIELPLPSLAEQQHVAALLSEQMAAAEQARKALQAQLDAINRLPAALLRRAFNGEL